MNWDDLRVVSTINRTGSFTRAAAALEVDETTIARRVARIQQDLGVTLFAASHGRREPTEDCRRILGHLAAMEEASAAIGTLLTEPHVTSRRLRLSTISAIANYYLAPALPELLGAEPDLVLSIDTSDQNIVMSRWEADFALRLGRPRRGDFSMRRVGTLQFALVRPSDPSVEPFLVTYPEALVDAPEMQALQAVQGAARHRLETSDLALMRRFLATGRGLGILPDRLARAMAANPAVIIEAQDVTREVWLLSQPHLRDDSLARSVYEWCAKQFAPTQHHSKE